MLLGANYVWVDLLHPSGMAGNFTNGERSKGISSHDTVECLPSKISAKDLEYFGNTYDTCDRKLQKCFVAARVSLCCREESLRDWCHHTPNARPSGTLTTLLGPVITASSHTRVHMYNDSMSPLATGLLGQIRINLHSRLVHNRLWAQIQSPSVTSLC